MDSDPDQDLYVEAKMASGSSPADSEFLPLEPWGTGVLQVIQLLAYVLLFEPELLLIDEPDSHVHPSSQKRLMLALEHIALDMNCRIVLSTHSRHVVSAAPHDASVVWMKDGSVVDHEDTDLIALLMDLGALDSFDRKADILVATEDQETHMLAAAVSAVKDGRRVKLTSFGGLNNATNAQAFRSVSELVGYGPKVVVHRDRDFLTDKEIEKWSRSYTANDISVFCPKFCDVEYYHTTSAHISKVTGWSLEESELLRSRVIADNTKGFRKKFEQKRSFANSKLWPDGGSPTNESLWCKGEPIPEEYIYGKSLMNLLDQEIKKELGGKGVRKLQSVPSTELQQELQEFLDSLS